ncbi:MAG: type IV secretion system DNA-binding domain-containing protein [Candidatus Jacksonbacteria bacterium]|jgi:hypothetical protein|nr:type IV secretion system DNA-binding domain-containing protein [Candidatus Jacksonbacteria bacterium]MBT6034061.1 type IV secretion system DNA-binding domain-containing protein [Candidatus Jacksonbacteria bacterium]MBT6301541.1 type IV secretion system DNA-binding domain-containing protein [Candidatus Jacksonbacteria bacterium]MBT7008061.1 type IV secretion system DNA-binding domain-containing protein [Candidatus Jacksonbacteria bacterium]
MTTQRLLSQLPPNTRGLPGSVQVQSASAIETLFIVLFVIVGVLVLATLVFFLLRWRNRKRYKVNHTFGTSILKITLPKEGSDQDQEEEKKSFAEIIGVAEVLFSNLAGLPRPKWWARYWRGEEIYVSLEVVAYDQLVHFYIVVPQALSTFVEQQVHAQYHQAHVEEVEDYNIFSPYGETRAAALVFRRHEFFPIKTYKQLETADPLEALTNALSKIGNKEGAAIQVLIRPIRRKWTKKGLKVASKMQQGKSLKKALREVGMGSPGMKALSPLTDSVASATQTALGNDPKEMKSTDKAQELYRLSPLEEEIVKGIEDKASRYAFQANVRVVASSPTPGKAEVDINSITNAFSQYDAGEKGNGFKRKLKNQEKIVENFISRTFIERNKVVLNTEELTSVWHLPHPDMDAPNIQWLSAKRAAPPQVLPKEGLLLGYSDYRGKKRDVYIEKADRRRHAYIIGRSGSGKSVLIANLAIQDILNGEGVCVIDPHGDLVDSILEHVPKERVDDVVYFNPGDTDRPIGLNMLEFKTEEQMDFVVQEMIQIFYKLFPPEMIGPMFEHNMRNVMLTLMADKEHPGTIADIPRMFTDEDFQKYKIGFVTDPVVLSFWEKEMAQTSDFHKSEMLGYLISKVGRFVENEMMRNIIGQPKSGFDVRDIMDNKKILLVNLSKGKTGEVNSNLIGLILVAKLQIAALSRAELPEDQRSDFYLYIDEFQNFVTDSIATILSEARKYRLDLTIAHQYVSQLILNNETKIRDAVFGNVGTLISYRVGVEDAELFAKEYSPVFNEYDVINIEKYTTYIKLLIDNTAARPFDMKTYPPKEGNSEMGAAIKELSRLKYGRDKKSIQQEILKRTKLGETSTKSASLKDSEPSR